MTKTENWLSGLVVRMSAVRSGGHRFESHQGPWPGHATDCKWWNAALLDIKHEGSDSEKFAAMYYRQILGGVRVVLYITSPYTIYRSNPVLALKAE